MSLLRNASASLAALVLLTGASSAMAEDEQGWKFEGSRAEEISAKSLDILIVRPLATARFAAGTVLMLPAMLLSSPMGREGFDGAYEVLMEEPAEYAFRRPIGEF